MRSIGADVSLVYSYSAANANDRMFWAEVFVDNTWLPVFPQTETIGVEVSHLNFLFNH